MGKKKGKEIMDNPIESTGLVVNTTAIDIMNLNNELFKNVDFSGLTNAIENLGNHSTDLTAKEKKYAVEIVNNWNSNVKDRINLHNQDISNILSFFVPDANSTLNATITLKKLEQLSEAVGLEQLFTEYTNLTESISSKSQEIQYYFEDPDKTYTENKLVKNKLDYENAKLHIQIEKLKSLQRNKLVTLINEMNKTEPIISLIENSRIYSTTVKKMKNECDIKTDMAKLNIYISSTETRKALKELMEFAKTI